MEVLNCRSNSHHGPRSGGTTSLPSYLVEAEESAPETHSSEQLFGNSTSSEAFLSLQPAHEVFLSHSGRQKAFVEQLYKDFEGEGQYPFFDVTSHSLPKGEKFPPRIFKAARECKVAVIILTEDFLTTKWPMMELITFVDAQKTINPRLKLFPVLYNRLSFEDLQVDRWKKEWIKLEQSSHRRDLSNILTLEKCAEALKTLRQVVGLKCDKSDVELRMAIVKETVKLLPKKSDTDMKEIQGADRLCEVLSKMFQYGADHRNEVQYLGLYGMGGLGKTTMCKALCEHFSSEFDSKVYHVELEFEGYEPERARKQLNRQKILLRKLTALSKHAAENIQEPSAAKDRLKERLKLIPVFLAVDNVQDEEPSRQEARDYLECISCPGSKVLITSRSQDIVNRVLDDKTRCNLIPFMNEEEAMKLFLKTSRLGVPSLNPEITQILRECLEYCRFPFEEGANSTCKDNDSGHYHPLALRAAACFLQDIPESKWKEKLYHPSLMLHHSRESKQIHRILGLGFDSLCDDGKQLFFDIALHTPPFLDADKIFEWLVNIHGKPANLVDTKLRDLRRKAFLDYQDTGPKTMINMHDLYKDFAKQYLANTQHKEFGIYLEDPSVIEASNWSAVPRVSLLKCKVYLPEVRPWSSVVMVHLVQCENLYNFSIGHLYNLRHLMILECSKLELLSWTEQTVDKGGDQPVPDLLRRGWGVELRFVELLYNRSLKGLPDFSPCSKLQSILVKECCPLVEPMIFQSCSSLEKLRFLGENTPRVELIQSCPKLTTVQFAWRNSYGRMPELRDLPLLKELVLNGPSTAFEQHIHSMPSKTIRECFLQQYSKELGDHNLPGILGLPTNLEKLDLKYMPMRKLPEPAQLKILQVLNLKGCLLSQLVDFSTLSSLRELIIAWTNVEEVRGIDHLLELELFQCEFCFQLKKIPHLDRLQKLKYFSVFCCNELRGIPRLPQQYLGGVPERDSRIMHGALSSHDDLTIPSISEMGVFLDHTSKSIHGRFHFSASQLAKVHATIQCDGCKQSPLIGPRFKAKDIYGIDLEICNLCCTKKCDRSVACQESGRIIIEGLRWASNYNLCLKCFETNGCNLDDFQCIHQTLSDPSDARATTKSRSPRLDLMAKYASLAESSGPEYRRSSSLQNFLLQIPHYHSRI